MMLRIWSGAKTGEYREISIPEAHANTIADARDEPDDEPIVDVSKRTLRRRILRLPSSSKPRLATSSSSPILTSKLARSKT
ncbi:Transcriptional regulator, contains HTH domain [Halapricum desulfuricans]|uniref:Transcriptional regulator, contains HTH domain n=1 Tax=Halapricum desulfuricans TaxID=2841257 RepID=A0A897N2I4_9EURY|nr:hypothetical protein [Halapricum desulfuricans]QSG05523.1 Transcriptional regulator, contains HTH domain [Halapricum desulfuricans]